MFYTKPPLEEPSHKKKSKKKNTNALKTVFFEAEEAKTHETPAISTENPNKITISEDDYLNDLSEYQEELLNTAFFEEIGDFQPNSNDFSSTCNEILSLFQDKSLENLEKTEYEHMLQVCQENAKWYLPIQAAFETENTLEIIDEFLINDEDYFIAIQRTLFELAKKSRKTVRSDYESGSTHYSSKFPSLSESNPTASQDFLDFLRAKPENSKNSQSSVLNFNNLELNNTRNSWFEVKNQELFQTFKENSGDEVKGLSLLFPNIGLNYIKIAYLSFGEQFEETKRFLTDYFKDSYKAGAIVENTKLIHKNQASKSAKFVNNPANSHLEAFEQADLSEIPEELRNETFASLRGKVSKHLKLRLILKKSENTCVGLKNHSEAGKFKQMANEQDVLLRKYMHASKVLFLDKLRRKKLNFREIDLHGLFLEEALEILVDQIKYLKNRLAMGLVTDAVYKEIKGVKHLKYDIITGKGKNSRNKCPVLLPNVRKFLEKRGYQFKSVDNEGKIELYLPTY